MQDIFNTENFGSNLLPWSQSLAKTQLSLVYIISLKINLFFCHQYVSSVVFNILLENMFYIYKNYCRFLFTSLSTAYNCPPALVTAMRREIGVLSSLPTRDTLATLSLSLLKSPHLPTHGCFDSRWICPLITKLGIVCNWSEMGMGISNMYPVVIKKMFQKVD